MTKLSELMHHPWIGRLRARLSGQTAPPSEQQPVDELSDTAQADVTMDAAAPGSHRATQASIVAHAGSPASPEAEPARPPDDAAGDEAPGWELKPTSAPRRLMPRRAQVGVLGIALVVIWWTWPRNGAPDYTLAAQWNSRSAAPGTVELAVVNPANAARATAVAGSGIMSTLGNVTRPTADFPSIIVVTPTASGETLPLNVDAEIPVVLLEASGQLTESASSLIELDIPAGNALVPALAEASVVQAAVSAPLELVLPTATPTSAPQVVALATVPRVEVVPAAGVTPVAVAETPTPVPTAIPSPTPPSVGPGRLWSTFTPRPPADSDHFWVGNPFAGFASNRFASPSYQFGSTAGNRYRPHHGVDISNPLGTPVRSGVEGVVVHAGPDDPDLLGPYPNFFGKAVVLLLDRRLPVAGGELDVYLLYGHLSEVRVAVGQKVVPEDVIGLVGMTGIAIGPHLHVEVRLGANTYNHSVNPYLWMEPPPGHGAVAVRVLTADGRTWAGAKVSIARFQDGQAVWARQIETYLDTENIGPNPAWGENGAMGDVPAGVYYLIANIDGESLRAEFTVRPGETTFVELRTGR